MGEVTDNQSKHQFIDRSLNQFVYISKEDYQSLKDGKLLSFYNHKQATVIKVKIKLPQTADMEELQSMLEDSEDWKKIDQNTPATQPVTQEEATIRNFPEVHNPTLIPSSFPISLSIATGDFNQVEYIVDKIGGSTDIQGWQDFISWRLMSKLQELPYQGPQFTWTNNREGDELILERLDRAYASNSWSCIFPEARLWHYPIATSDHAVIMLETSPARKRKKTPYRIDNWCLQQKDIEDLRSLDSDESNNHLKNSLTREAKIKHDFWLQRAKVRYAQEGHAPTKYLFQKARAIKKRNNIGALKDNEGNWCYNESRLRTLLYKDFHSIYKVNTSMAPTPQQSFSALDSLPLKSLTVDQSQWLDSPFTAEEVRDAVFSIGDNKSPGIDGFTSAFFKRFAHERSMSLLQLEEQLCYLAMKLDMNKAFDEFHGRFFVIFFRGMVSPANGNNSLWKPSPQFLIVFLSMASRPTILTLNVEFAKIITEFEEVSGQMVNYAKSYIKYSPNAPPDFRQYLSALLRIQSKDNFGVYRSTGDIGRNKVASFCYLLDRVTNKLTLWNSLNLSQSAKLSGGLQLRNIHVMNQALLAKNYHRVMNNPQLLLSKVIKAKYSRDCGVIPPLKSNHYRPSWGWKSILKAAHKLQDGFAWKLGNGAKVNLLSDPWINGNKPVLAIEPPRKHLFQYVRLLIMMAVGI
ncbi:uncharacterized protein LOC141602046 [Silene latifolia]|uniref:uncharacterized protein LOC141602046 n=1 Tax=Silene latifolia TaxID=37657 RepID=UPI003D78A6B6